MSSSFEDRVKMLNKLGVEHYVDQEYRGPVPRQPHPIKVFTTIVLPFSPEEWCGLCMNEGEHYIGGCCGSSSSVQDSVNHIFREGGEVECRDLAEIAQSMATHDGDDSNEDFSFGKLSGSLEDLVDKAHAEWRDIDPWAKMAVIWQIVKDHYAPEEPRGMRKDIPKVEAAVHVLSSGLRFIDYCRFFGGSEKNDLGEKGQDRANDILNLARILPALKTLNERIDELDPGAFEGFALIDMTKGPDEIAKNRRGLCLYATQADVDAVMNLWRRRDAEFTDEKRAPVDERITYRPVRVTPEKGIEFLDTDEVT